MPRTRKNHPPSLTAKVALEAIKAHRTTTQIAQMFGVHPTQVGGWKIQGADRIAGYFRQRPPAVAPTGRRREGRAVQADRAAQVELDFLKKKLASSIEDRRPWIDPHHPQLTIQQQCELLGLRRSTYYYQPRPESDQNLRLLRELDELYLHGGRPCIAGTGVTVRRIAVLHNMREAPEEIANDYGHLSLAQVHAALAYYYAHKAEIDADLEAEEREHDALAEQHRR